MWNEPLKSFGLVHLLAFIIGLSLIPLGYMLGKKYSYQNNKKLVNKIFGFTGLLLICLEAFKQIFNACTIGFSWDQLPLQICSMDLYLLLVIPFVHNEKIKRYLVGFVAYVSLSAATYYFVKPSAALKTSYIVMSFQSFLWHHVDIAIGAFAIGSFALNKKEEWKTFLGTLGVFACLTFVLIGVNEIFNAKGIDVQYFYINRVKETFYPGLNWIFKPDPKPYPLFILAFLIYFSGGSAIFYGLSILLGNIKKKNN